MIHITDDNANARFHKSSFSDPAKDNCIEVADLTGTSVAPVTGVHGIRDTQNRELGALLFGADAFAAFTTASKRDRV